jgi:hypothetical protein
MSKMSIGNSVECKEHWLIASWQNLLQARGKKEKNKQIKRRKENDGKRELLRRPGRAKKFYLPDEES